MSIATAPVFMVALACMAASLMGCGGGSGAVATPNDAPSPLPKVPATGAKVLFDRFEQQLLAYDLKAKEEVDRGDKDGYSAYAFPTSSSLLTVGDQNGRDFSVVRVRGGEVQTVLRLPGRQGIFPVAASDETAFFVVNRYDASGEQVGAGEVARLVGDRLEKYPSVRGALGGALLKGFLYYTTFEKSSEKYKLFRVPVARPDGRPRLVASGLDHEELYAYDGQLYRAKGGRVVGSGRSYPCPSADLCQFDDTHHIFLSMSIDDESGLALTIRNADTGARLFTVRNVIDYAIRPGRLIAYRDGNIRTVPLKRP